MNHEQSLNVYAMGSNVAKGVLQNAVRHIKEEMQTEFSNGTPHRYTISMSIEEEIISSPFPKQRPCIEFDSVYVVSFNGYAKVFFRVSDMDSVMLRIEGSYKADSITRENATYTLSQALSLISSGRTFNLIEKDMPARKDCFEWKLITLDTEHITINT